MTHWTLRAQRIQKTCQFCGKEFHAIHPCAKYCGKPCTDRAHKLKKNPDRMGHIQRPSPVKSPHPEDRSEVHPVMLRWRRAN